MCCINSDLADVAYCVLIVLRVCKRLAKRTRVAVGYCRQEETKETRGITKLGGREMYRIGNDQTEHNRK